MSMQLGSESVAPPWDSIPGQVLCPLCEYDLRGLAEPRCPECGFTFTWAQVLDPTCRLHPYLFEHHPEHSAWAFRKTFVAALLPRRFWRNLHPAQPSCPRRLILYWLLASLLSWIVVVAGGIGQISWHWQATFKVNAAYGAQQLAYWKGLQISEVKRARAIKEFGSLENAVDAWYPTHWTWALFIDILRARYGLLMVPLLPAALPWLTFASLMIFRMSMPERRLAILFPPMA